MNDQQTREPKQERIDPKNDGRGGEVPSKSKSDRGADHPPESERSATPAPREGEADSK